MFVKKQTNVHWIYSGISFKDIKYHNFVCIRRNCTLFRPLKWCIDLSFVSSVHYLFGRNLRMNNARKSHFKSFITHKTNSTVHFIIYSKTHFESFITHNNKGSLILGLRVAWGLDVKHPRCIALCIRRTPNLNVKICLEKCVLYTQNYGTF